MKEVKTVYSVFLPEKTIEIFLYYMGKKEEELPFELRIDDQDPDYLLTNECIYYERTARNTFKRLCKKDQVRIFDCGECLDPDLNLFDYAITYNYDLKCIDRVMKHFHPGRLKYRNDIVTHEQAINELHNKKEFCNFIYSNGKGHARRTELFEAICHYKQVDSLGRYLNNKKISEQWDTLAQMLDSSIILKKPYKFSIACENATYRGYISEKLETSLRAHTVPIYWGSPTVSEEFNEQAIINCHKYSSMGEVIERIRQIDEDDELWTNMVMQPWHTVEQYAMEEKYQKDFYLFFNHIFDQPLQEARRRGDGFHPEKYENYFLNGMPFDYKSIIKKVLGMSR